MESIVISSKIRLARNIQDLPFPNKLSDFENAKGVAKAIYEIFGDEFTYTSLKNMPQQKQLLLLENGTISNALSDNKDIASFASNPDKNIVILINEDDHIREICKLPGESLDLCYDRLNKVDNKILNKLDISYSKNLGFLTASPKNVGTAMKASVELFLPALNFNNAIEQISQSLLQSGLILKNDETYGKDGYFYILHNKYTLGLSESDIINTVKKGAQVLVDLEQKARKTLLDVNKTVIMDMCLRSYGILTNSYILPYDECIEKLSKIRFGMVLGLIKIKNPSIVDDLFCQSNLGHLQDFYSLELNSIEEKIFRAKFVMESLENKLIKGVR